MNRYKLTSNQMSEQLIDINENIQLVVFVERHSDLNLGKSIYERGFLVFNLNGIIYAPLASKFSLKSLLWIIAIVLAVILLYFFVIKSPFIFLVLLGVFLVNWFEFGAMYDSLVRPSAENRLRKIKSEIEIDGYASSKWLKDEFSVAWNNVSEVSFRTSECKLNIKTVTEGNLEFHLYNDNFIGLHPECTQAVDSIKKIMKHYLPDEKRKWSP